MHLDQNVCGMLGYASDFRSRRRMLARWSVSCFLIILLAPTHADIYDFFSAVPYGPFDYRNPVHVREKLPVVEKYHFNADIETLQATMPGGFIGGHLLYVVRAFPNHHRALQSYTKLWQRNQAQGRIPQGVLTEHSPEFLYERALGFFPDDGTVRLLYGMYLLDSGRSEEARIQIDAASRLGPDDAETHYNLGLIYLRLQDHGPADKHARRAYELGHPLPGLRRKMIAEGLWSAQGT